MKNTSALFKISTLLIILTLAACSNSTDFSNVYKYETDFQYPYLAHGQTMGLASNGDGYYFLSGKYLYYADQPEMKPVLLDNRPDSTCLQASAENDRERCNAYFETGSTRGFLAYYDDNIYTIESETILRPDKIEEIVRLIELAPDGSKRKERFTFEFPPMAIAMHRGVLYYLSKDYSMDSELSYELMRYPLNGLFAKPASVYSGNLPNGHIQDIVPYGKYVYFTEFGTGAAGRLMMYDIENQTVSRLLSDDDAVSTNLLGIANQRLIFSYFAGEVDDPLAWKIYSSDLEGQDIRELPVQSEFLSYVHATDEHLFVTPVTIYLDLEPYQDKYSQVKKEMTIYDWNYQVVDRIDISGLTGMPSMIAGDERTFFVKQISRDGNEQILYIDKNSFGSGELQLQPLF